MESISSVSSIASGECRCGRYRFETRSKPFLVSYCHCNDCRKATGAVVTVFVGFNESYIRILGDKPNVYESSSTVRRFFCKYCGTPIGYKDNKLPSEMYHYLGIFDDPSRFTPQFHSFVSERLPWVDIEDDLPKYERFSRPRVKK